MYLKYINTALRARENFWQLIICKNELKCRDRTIQKRPRNTQGPSSGWRSSACQYSHSFILMPRCLAFFYMMGLGAFSVCTVEDKYRVPCKILYFQIHKLFPLKNDSVSNYTPLKIEKCYFVIVWSSWCWCISVLRIMPNGILYHKFLKQNVTSLSCHRCSPSVFRTSV